MVLHIFFLHSTGSSNPLGLDSSSYKLPFHYYHSAGDFFGFIVFGFLLLLGSLTLGYTFMDAENFIPANPLQTPAHIQPEWYFLFAYAILRSIPNKLGGVIALVFSIALLFVFPIFTPYMVGGLSHHPLTSLVF